MTITGLRQRLEGVDGVQGIELELGEGGLSGIKVKLSDGADEGVVLERVRSLLVTYGFRHSQPQPPEPAPTNFRAAATWTRLQADKGGMLVEVGRGEQVVSRVVEADPVAAAQGVVSARCELDGLDEPQMLWMGLDRIGEWRVLTVLLRFDDEPPSAGCAVVVSGWADALGEAVGRALV
ncbi:MAG TPA: hypothetical protein VID03_08370 [Acidimicrobiia bacterium]|jgi:hypothetical protein